MNDSPTPLSWRSCLLVCVLSLVFTVGSVTGEQVQVCSLDELNSLSDNTNVRQFADNNHGKLGPFGCKSLQDQDCFCARPEFMAAVSGCLFEVDSNLQSQVIRCLKWYECALLQDTLNKTGVGLTPASSDLLSKGRPTFVHSGSLPRLSRAVCASAILPLGLLFTLFLWSM